MDGQAAVEIEHALGEIRREDLTVFDPQFRLNAEGTILQVGQPHK